MPIKYLAKPKKRTRVTTRKRMIKQADMLWSLLVRSPGYCQLLGKDKVKCSPVLQGAHIIGRGNWRLRYELFNGLCLCKGHHVYYTHHPFEWEEITRRLFPKNYELIDPIKNETWDKDIDAVLERLKEAGRENEVK